MNKIFDNPYVQAVIGGLIVSIIWSVFSRYIPFIKKVKAGNKSQLLFFLSILLFFVPIFTYVAVYIGRQPLSLPVLLITIVFLLISFFTGVIAYRIYFREVDLYFFIKTTQAIKQDKVLSQDIKSCLCSLRRAFHEIEKEFDLHFRKGQRVDLKQIDIKKGEQITRIPTNFDENKITTTLEHEIYAIYIKYISKTAFSNGNIISDIYGDTQSINTEVIQDYEYRWVLDPIDGGFHFVNNIPLFTTCVALQQKDKSEDWMTLLSAIYIPLTHELFFAIKGKGAYLNTWENRLPLVKRNTDLSISIFYFEFPNRETYNRDKNNNEEDKGLYVTSCNFLKDIFNKVAKTRGFNLGSFGLSYVAKGSFDAYISLSGGTSFYDSAAGILLVEESYKKEQQNSRGFVRYELVDSKLDEIKQGARILATSEGIFNEMYSDKKLKEHLDKMFPHIKPLRKIK